MTHPPPQPGLHSAVRPWMLGRQISIYLKARPKPLVNHTLCYIHPSCLVTRWTSSTHIIPIEAIAYLRFMPDSEPCRDIDHPLYEVTRHDRHQVTSRRSAHHTYNPDAVRRLDDVAAGIAGKMTAPTTTERKP